MTRILFLCHGNICRSPMAEFVMKKLLAEAGREDVRVESAALHTDEIGNDIHPGTRAKLIEKNIPFAPRAAWLLTAEKARDYDYLIGCDRWNVADLRRLVQPADRSKIRKLLEFAGSEADIADPWYTGDFDQTYDDVEAGCRGLLAKLGARKLGVKILALLLATASFSTALAGESYSFGMISDSHWTGPEYYDGGNRARKDAAEYRAEWMVRERKNLLRAAKVCMDEPSAAFIVHTGDMVDGRCGNLARQVAQLKDGWDLTRGAFPSNVPFIAANGNHETYDFEAPGTYAYPGYAMTVQQYIAKELGRAHPVERHFSFKHGPDLFIVYNSNVDEYEFFKQTLAENRDVRYVFAVGHIPAINPCEDGIEIDSPERGNRMDTHNRFLRLLQSRNVILLCGDTHRIGMVDYVTGEGRLTELMGVSVFGNGGFRELAASVGDFPINWNSAYQPGGVISKRQRFLKGGLVRFWGAKGAGFWKLHVSDARVTADLYTWDCEGVVKSIVLRGEGVECHPVTVEVNAPLSNGVNRLKVKAPVLENVKWRTGLPIGWSARPFKPGEGVLEVTLPDKVRLERKEVAIKLYAVDDSTGRVVANEDRHFMDQEVFGVWHQSGYGCADEEGIVPIPEIRRFAGRTTNQGFCWLANPWPDVYQMNSVEPDFSDEDELWKGYPLKLELFFDLKNSKKAFMDGDAVQVVVLHARKRQDVPFKYREDEVVQYRALIIRDGGKTRKWVNLTGTARAPVIPFRLIAPTDSPDFRGADVIGMDAFFNDIPLMGAVDKRHDNPSMWGNAELERPDAPSIEFE